MDDKIEATQPIVLDDEIIPEEEDMQDALDAERDAMIEETVKERVDLWLDTHGAKLFALEFSKAAVKESKKAVARDLSNGTGNPAVPKRKTEEPSVVGPPRKRRR